MNKTSINKPQGFILIVAILFVFVSVTISLTVVESGASLKLMNLRELYALTHRVEAESLKPYIRSQLTKYPTTVVYSEADDFLTVYDSARRPRWSVDRFFEKRETGEDVTDDIYIRLKMTGGGFEYTFKY